MVAVPPGATQAELDAHVAAADPHVGYRLESVAIAAADVAADVATQAELDAAVAGLRQRFKSQYLYSSAFATLGTMTPTLNRAYFLPIRLAAVEFDNIGVSVVGAGGAGSVVRLGIYASDAFGFPTGLPLLDAGTVDSTGTGDLRITIAYTPPAFDLYHLVCVPQVGTVPTMIGTTNSGVNNQLAPIASHNTGAIGFILTGVLTGALADITGQTFTANSSTHIRTFLRAT